MSDKINNGKNIEISDIYKINPYEYFIVTSIENNKITGIIRDGIYVIGAEPYQSSHHPNEIVSKITNDEWEHMGKYSYEGKNINGNKI